MKNFVELVYAALIGICVALFVGFGVWAFYPGPKFPEFPQINYSTMGEPSQEDKAKQEQYDKDFKDWQAKDKKYGQKVALITLVPAVLFYVIGLKGMRRMEVVGEGLALGGVATTLYATMRAAGGDQRGIVFGSVAILLVMIVFLAQKKFSGENWQPSKKK